MKREFKKKLLSLDFDGTCVKNEFPKVGGDVKAVPVLKKLVDSGIKIILSTMRSDEYLDHAIDWFNLHDIPLYSIQQDPNQYKWTSSTKCYSEMYIGDDAYGAPLIYDDDKCKGYINWKKLEQDFISWGYIK